MAVLLGNVGARNANWSDRVQGSGVRNVSDAPSRVELHGKAGEFVILRSGDVQYSNVGVVMQAVGGIVEVSFTLCNPALAMDRDPAIQAIVPWANVTTVNPTDIVDAPVQCFSAVKIEFKATADFFMMGR